MSVKENGRITFQRKSDKRINYNGVIYNLYFGVYNKGYGMQGNIALCLVDNDGNTFHEFTSPVNAFYSDHELVALAPFKHIHKIEEDPEAAIHQRHMDITNLLIDAMIICPSQEGRTFHHNDDIGHKIPVRSFYVTDEKPVVCHTNATLAVHLWAYRELVVYGDEPSQKNRPFVSWLEEFFDGLGEQTQDDIGLYVLDIFEKHIQLGFENHRDILIGFWQMMIRYNLSKVDWFGLYNIWKVWYRNGYTRMFADETKRRIEKGLMPADTPIPEYENIQFMSPGTFWITPSNYVEKHVFAISRRTGRVDVNSLIQHGDFINVMIDPAYKQYMDIFVEQLMRDFEAKGQTISPQIINLLILENFPKLRLKKSDPLSPDALFLLDTLDMRRQAEGVPVYESRSASILRLYEMLLQVSWDYAHPTDMSDVDNTENG